jgi:ankyrin repeat protein
MNPDVLNLLRKVQSTPDFASVQFDSIDATNALGDNALHCVCVWGDLVAAKLLVGNGININQPGEHGFTPLRVAAEFGFTALVEYLVKSGADSSGLGSPAKFDPQANALHMQQLRKQLSTHEERLQHGQATNGRADDA